MSKLKSIIKKVISEYGYSDKNPKIELQYRDSKGEWHYLASTNWAKTVKEAEQKMREKILNNPADANAYAKKVGESIDIKRIKGYEV